MNREVPDGFVAFGWYTGGDSLAPRSVNMGLRFSDAHLAPAEQAGHEHSRRRPYEAVCGRRMRTRRGTVEWPDEVVRSVGRGDRKWCERCWGKI